MDVESGRRVIVGVNKFTQEEEPPKNLLRVDGSVGKLQAEKIAKVKATRDNAKVKETLDALEKLAMKTNPPTWFRSSWLLLKLTRPKAKSAA